METTLQVLCPNGRRQNVKVNPHTKFLQVLEEVCTKQSFLPSDNYDLIHGRKVLDLALAFSFSNLPKNAKLELVKAAVPRSLQEQANVTIALQLEDGVRLQHAFPPSTTLWDILQYWESSNENNKGQLMNVDTTVIPSLHPVCIYMRDEITGEAALKDTTLKKLALTTGKAIIRLVHRPVDDATLGEIQTKINQENTRQAKLHEKAQQQQVEPFSAVSTCSQVSSPVDPMSPPLRASQHEQILEEKMDINETDKQAQGNDQSTLSEPMDSSDGRSPPIVDNSVNLAHSNLVQMSTGHGSSSSSSVEHLHSLNIPGVEIITPQDFHNLTPQEQEVARALAHQYMPSLVSSGQQQALSASTGHVALQPTFAGFKFPEETKGMNLYQNELSDVKREDFQPCDREVVVYDSNEQNTSKAMAEDIPDEFFEVTDHDIRSLYKDLKKQVDTEKPLMTETMRQARLEEKYGQYDYVVIRIQFPDGLVLQGCFRPRERVFALHQFVREHLENPAQEFYLYRAPPKTIFSKLIETLVEADLAPASLLYFHTENKNEHQLSASTRKIICPKRRADELSVKKLAKKRMESVSPECSGGDVESAGLRPNVCSSDKASKQDGASRADSTSRETSAIPGMPKWLKLGKK